MYIWWQVRVLDLARVFAFVLALDMFWSVRLGHCVCFDFLKNDKFTKNSPGRGRTGFALRLGGDENCVVRGEEMKENEEEEKKRRREEEKKRRSHRQYLDADNIHPGSRPASWTPTSLS
jgi:hypothetical protein